MVPSSSEIEEILDFVENINKNFRISMIEKTHCKYPGQDMEEL